MESQLQKYYENRFSMCASDAWRDLIEDVQGMLDAANGIEGISTLEQLHFRKGEVSIMRWILSLESVSQNAYEELQRESDV